MIHFPFPPPDMIRHGTELARSRRPLRYRLQPRPDQRTDPDMPSTKSAAKRLRQSEKRRMRNRIAKKIIKTYTKRTLSAIEKGNLEQAAEDFRFAISRIDKAGARRILHPNTADRRKAKLTRDYEAALARAKG